MRLRGIYGSALDHPAIKACFTRMDPKSLAPNWKTKPMTNPVAWYADDSYFDCHFCARCWSQLRPYRLNVEIGVYGEAHPQHPLLWVARGLIAGCSMLEVWFVHEVHAAAEQLGRNRRQSSIGEPLNRDSTPLLQGAGP
jgi:hypothetical protein